LLSLRSRGAGLRALHPRVHADRRGAHPGRRGRPGRRAPRGGAAAQAGASPSGRGLAVNELLRPVLLLPPQMSSLARELDALHYSVILTTMAGATLVTLVGGYFLIRYRRREHAPAEANPDATVQPHFVFKLSALVLLIVLFLVWWIIGVRE